MMGITAQSIKRSALGVIKAYPVKLLCKRKRFFFIGSSPRFQGGLWGNPHSPSLLLCYNLVVKYADGKFTAAQRSCLLRILPDHLRWKSRPAGLSAAGMPTRQAGHRGQRP